MLLGCIGDDFTGSSDVANTLAKGGMRVVQYNGVPREPADAAVEAGVVALKTRTVPAEDAVQWSLAALDWLKAQGCRQFLFKYCSTFDSTPEGNIGPVLDALSEALGAEHVAVCPAFPATGRTLYQGHLFVGDRLLSESGMRNHPLTPMADPDIRRWLAHQTRHAVGHVPHRVVVAGADAVREAMAEAGRTGGRHIVIDAIDDADLLTIGKALADDALLSGGSGIALGLPRNFREKGLIVGAPRPWAGRPGPAAVLCGSCSEASRRQIALHAKTHPAREITAAEIMTARTTPVEAAAWTAGGDGEGRIPLLYSSADPEEVRRAQQRFGRERLAAAIEHFFADTARALAEHGICRLIVAGGETSGAVVSGLGIPAFEIGPEIAPGVPALRVTETDMVLALKSGNFGGDDFFARAAGILAGRVEGAKH